MLHNQMVCGSRDITGEPYAGMSGKHDRYGHAVSTSNGAGPHNVQMFILSSDGTVLTCMPGYWAPQDLVTEVRLAQQLNTVWKDPHLSRAQKNQMFAQMQMAHIRQHSPQMVGRSHMQGFDMMYEAENRPMSDTIKSPELIAAAEAKGGHAPAQAFKTTDVIMHERMARRPFESIDHFDVAAFADYGKWKYDKEEDARMADGRVDMEKARYGATIGDPQAEKMHPGAKKTKDPDSHVWGSHSWGSSQ
jgi:hypothetical protein